MHIGTNMTMTTTPINTDNLFKSSAEKLFPSCTQLTVVHGYCDSYCTACPIGQHHYGEANDAVKKLFAPENNAFMDPALFKRIAAEVALHPQHAWLRLHGRGEPLLHPNIIEMLADAKHAGVKIIQCFTNAISLNENKARALLTAGLDVLECSVHGHTQTYEKLMRNNKYAVVTENIIRYSKLKKDLNPKAKLVVSAVDQPMLQSEKAAHKKFWSQYADEVIYRPYHSWGNRIDKDNHAAMPQRHCCPQLWTRCTIGLTGKILACFNNWEELDEDVIGDLAKDPELTIAQAWQSATYQSMRHNHSSGCYSKGCSQCKDWIGSSWGDNSYEHLLESKLALKNSKKEIILDKEGNNA